MSQSPARAARRKGFLPPVKRNLLPEECLQLQEMNRMINARKWEAAQIKGNTALIPDGQKIAAQLEAIADVLDGAGKQWIAQTLVKCGYQPGTKCSLNLSTGEIILEKQ